MCNNNINNTIKNGNDEQQKQKYCDRNSSYTGAPCIKGSYKKKFVPQLLVRRNSPEYKVSKTDLTFVNGAVLIDLHPIEVHIRIEMLYVFIQ